MTFMGQIEQFNHLLTIILIWLSESFSLESDWQQFSPSLQDFSQYSVQS